MPSKKFQEFLKTFEAIDPIGQNQMLPGRVIGPTGVPVMVEGYEFPAPEIPRGYTGGAVTVGGVPGITLTRPGIRDGAALLHIHGGGFTEGAAMECMDILEFLTDKVNVTCFSVDYRLAPYHPYPAGLNDCIAFYQGLRDMGYSRILLGGQSAGACLSLGVTLSLKQQGKPLPEAVWCSSPPVDIRYDQRELYSRDIFTQLCPKIEQTYSPGADRFDPLLSPIYGDYRGFPPLLIQTGGGESLAEGCVSLAARAAAANVEVFLHFGQDMMHCFADPAAPYPEGVNAAYEIAEFYNRILDLNAE